MVKLVKTTQVSRTSSGHYFLSSTSSSWASNIINNSKSTNDMEQKAIKASAQLGRSNKSTAVTSHTKRQSSTSVSRVPRRLRSLKTRSIDQPTRNDQEQKHSMDLISIQQNFRLIDRNDQSFADRIGTDSFVWMNASSGNSTKSWPNLSSWSNDHHISSRQQQMKKKKKNCPAFSRTCLLLCSFCCLVGAILLATLIAALILNFTISHSTSTTTLLTTQTIMISTTTTTISTTTITTTTVTTSSTSTSTTTSATSTTTTSITTTSDTTTTTISTTSVSTICSTTAITTIITSSPLPPECSNYTLNTDGTRNAAYANVNDSCDSTAFSSSPMWVRFSGAAGTLLANCPIDPQQCDTRSTGWYSGVYPSTAGSTTSGLVCYNWYGNTCVYNNSISITNCNGYYVYALTNAPRCYLRYCTI